MKFRAGSLIMAAFLLCLQPMAAQVGGTGTTNHVPLWTNSSTLGNSVLFQSGGNVGVGNTAPLAILDVKGKPGINGINGGNAPTAFKVLGGLGAPSGTASGAGGPIQATSGTGATFAFPGGFPNARGGSGAIFLMTGGAGATCAFNGLRCTLTGGNGGSISLQPGSGGFGSISGHPGNISLAPTGGKVGVGTSTPTATLEVGIGHSTLADSWITRSSRRFKTNIQPLAGALEKIEQLQGVSYDRKADGHHEIGVVAEDVDQVVPELVSLDPETKEVQGVDYSRLTALLIEAVKTQQAEIQQLRIQVSQLISNRPGN
jgi:endosialidase-like protein